MSEVDLTFWLWVWVFAAAFALVRCWREGAGAGLVLTYVLTFGVMHWLAAFLFMLPWHSEAGRDLTALGMRESAIAMVAFAGGSEIVRFFLNRGLERGETKPASPVDGRLPTVYIGIGIFFYVFVQPVASRVPGLDAVAATGGTLMVVAIALKCWDGWVRQRTGVMWAWLAGTTVLPLLTVIVQGFLGYGFAAMVTVIAFVASFLRPRWKVVALGIVLTHIGLSVYVTYMRDRREIRAVVWSGAGVRDRVSQLGETFKSAEWFDPRKEEHLRRIDQRLNQDYLLGASVAYLEGGSVGLAHGSTIMESLYALVPRAVWANKPVVGGSGELVSIYTGLRFAEGTSVGIGQVMEAYINFGRDGVIVCFLFFGAVLATLDQVAWRRLQKGNAASFLLWYLPGLSLLQIGGSFAEATSSAAAALVIALALRRFLTRVLPDRRAAARDLAGDHHVDSKLSA